jgi:hypothetical protein
MVREHGIIPWDLYSLVLTHPTGGDRTIIEIKTGALI